MGDYVIKVRLDNGYEFHHEEEFEELGRALGKARDIANHGGWEIRGDEYRFYPARRIDCVDVMRLESIAANLFQTSAVAVA